MKRDLYLNLISWKNSKSRKPLILRGARQTGKTHLLKSFGRQEYASTVYLNFERDSKLSGFFENKLDPKHILEQLSIYSGHEIEVHNTLLIFDEIQECPAALNSLKYFCEDMPELHLATAGSLLGVKLANEKGFPVGKVNFVDLYPMTFFEFLGAIKQQQLRNFLLKTDKLHPIPSPLHDELIRFLKIYLFVGGMPEAIKTYVETNDLKAVRDVHNDILDAYGLDFAKHAPTDQIMKITAVWESVPNQMARENKKFIFTAVRKSARGREYESAIHWLNDAGLIHRSFNMSVPRLPLSAYRDNDAFKVFLLDVGLLGAMNQLAPQTILEPQILFTEFKGALTENFVAQEMVAQNFELHYWTSAGAAEVDFVFENNAAVFPLEVKSGLSQHQKSLRVYESKFAPHILLRTSPLNLKQDANLVNIPLYMMSLLRHILQHIGEQP